MHASHPLARNEENKSNLLAGRKGQFNTNSIQPPVKFHLKWMMTGSVNAPCDVTCEAI